MPRPIKLFEPKNKWLIIRGEQEILGSGESLRALLRDTTIPGEDTSSLFVVSPNGMKIGFNSFLSLTEAALI